MTNSEQQAPQDVEAAWREYGTVIARRVVEACLSRTSLQVMAMDLAAIVASVPITARPAASDEQPPESAPTSDFASYIEHCRSCRDCRGVHQCKEGARLWRALGDDRTEYNLLLAQRKAIEAGESAPTSEDVSNLVARLRNRVRVSDGVHMATVCHVDIEAAVSLIEAAQNVRAAADAAGYDRGYVDGYNAGAESAPAQPLNLAAVGSQKSFQDAYDTADESLPKDNWSNCQLCNSDPCQCGKG